MTDKKEKSMIQYFLLFMFSFEILFIFFGILYNQVFHLKKFSEGYIFDAFTNHEYFVCKTTGIKSE